MVHQVVRYLQRALERQDVSKVALVIIDGLALDQWAILRDVLTDQCSSLSFRENAAFAWIPTLTHISRQAIFAGKPPRSFASSIEDLTNSEPRLWKNAWQSDFGLGPQEVAYMRSLTDVADLERVSDLALAKCRAFGLVVDKVDKIVHGAQNGTATVHSEVHHWAKTGFMGSLLAMLLQADFRVYLTADHGNIQATGIGVPQREGVLVDQAGQRARIYTDATLGKKVLAAYPGAIEWTSTGLPEDFYSVLAPRRQAFVTEGDVTVTHGGLSLEEVVVPFIQVEEKS